MMETKRQNLGNYLPVILLAAVLLAPIGVGPDSGSSQRMRVLVLQAIAFGLAAVLLARATWSWTGVRRFLATGPNLALTLLVGWAALSFILTAPSGGRGRSIALVELMRLASGAALYFAAVYYCRSENRLRILPTLLLGGAVVAALGGIYSFLASAGAPATAAFGDKQLLGAFLCVLLPVTVAFTLPGQPADRRRFAGLAGALAAFALLLTGTRTSWISGVIGLLSVALLAYRTGALRFTLRRWLLATFAVFVVAMLLSALPVTRTVLSGRLAPASASATFGARLRLWSAAGQMIRARPLAGWGIGSFALKAGDYTREAPPAAQVEQQGTSLSSIAHNEYLQIAAEQGLIGLALYLAVLVGFFRQSVPAFCGMAVGTRKWLLLASLGAVAAQCVDALANPGWHFSDVNPLLWLLLGLGMAARSLEGRESNFDFKGENEMLRSSVAQMKIHLNLGAGLHRTARFIRSSQAYLVAHLSILLALAAFGVGAYCICVSLPSLADPVYHWTKWPDLDNTSNIDGNTVHVGKSVGVRADGVDPKKPAGDINAFAYRQDRRYYYNPFRFIFDCPIIGYSSITGFTLRQIPGDITRYKSISPWTASTGTTIDDSAPDDATVVLASFVSTPPGVSAPASSFTTFYASLNVTTKTVVTVITEIEAQFNASTDNHVKYNTPDVRSETGLKASASGLYKRVVVRLLKPLDGPDPIVSVRVAFPTPSLIAALYSDPTKPAPTFPYNYDTVPSATPSNVSITPPNGWQVYFNTTGTQTINGIVVDDTHPIQDNDLSYRSTLGSGAVLFGVLLTKIQNGASIEYQNSLPFSIAVTPDPTQITSGGFRFDHSTGLFLQQVTIKNVTNTALPGPISLVLSSLSDNTTLVNQTGITSNASTPDSPFIDLNVGSDNVFSPGESATVVLEFTNPGSTGITYTQEMLTGTDPR